MYRLLFASCLAVSLLFQPLWLAAADRTTCFIPLSSGTVADGLGSGAVLPHQPFESAGLLDPNLLDAWRRYMRVWEAHQQAPGEDSIRRFLGLPLDDTLVAAAKRGRSAPRELRWRAGSYRQIETPHFQIFTRAKPDTSRLIAEDLERCYWVWTQYFFPLWEGAGRVEVMLDGLGDSQSVSEHLDRTAARLGARRKLRVVLFRDAEEYQRTLSRHVAGAARSTGFYSDKLKLTFLYVEDPDDGATRHHELVHQLFLEATGSRLRRERPGQNRDFWLVEGIAGYFESLRLKEQTATVGGWDAPRLQYARYRVLVGGEHLPLEEMRREGMAEVQRRADLGRWYTHAIAHTHRLLDGGEAACRMAIFGQLAELYQIPADLAPVDDAALKNGGQLREFLRVDDAALLENPVDYPLSDLCLAACDISPQGLQAISPSSRLRWLDLSRSPVGDAAVQRLVPDPKSLQQLSVEASKVSADFAQWLDRASELRELDLSWTRLDDDLADSLSAMSHLKTLWLTGSYVGNETAEVIAKLPRLEAVDLQRSQVSDMAVEQLKRARPNLKVNPLELREP